MELFVNVLKSDELIECLWMERVIDDVLYEVNKCWVVYYD